METRQRVDEIGYEMESYRQRLDHRYRRVARLSLAATFFSVAAVIACYVVLKRTNASATQNQQALCTLRADLERRVHDGEKFLVDNPNGIPGLSASAIRTSLQGQKRTAAALKNVNCSDDG